MNPYSPPSEPVPPTSVSMIAIGILTVGIIGLGALVALLCGVSFNLEKRGSSEDDLVATLIMFGVPLIALAFIGIPAGMIHLRRRSILGQIPFPVYLLTLIVLMLLSVWGNPIMRWFSISLVCYIMVIVVSIRTAVRYQQACDG